MDPRLLKTTVLFLLPDAEPARAVVVGQEDPATDVDAVQAAVDRGGGVLLLGTFHFGDDGRVLLHRDVSVRGEADASGRPVTTIVGGDWPFCTPAPADVASAQIGPVISVERIHFREPAGSAIHLGHTGGACIRGNEVTALRRRPSITSFRCTGALIGAHDALVTITSIPCLITGSIVVIENHVSLASLDPTLHTGKGGLVHAADGAAAYVARNRITNGGCSRLDRFSR
jgi:hypothetical protein